MAARFPIAQASETAAIGALADELHGQVAPATTKTDATDAWSAAEMLSGLIRQSGANGALAITTATAAALIAAMPNVQVGSKFFLTYQNVGDATSTLIAGAGVTLVGTTAVPMNKTQDYIGLVTSPTTVSLYGKFYAPV